MVAGRREHEADRGGPAVGEAVSPGGDVEGYGSRGGADADKLSEETRRKIQGSCRTGSAVVVVLM
jgi:hypothetical protein